MKKLLSIGAAVALATTLLPIHAQAFFSDVPGTHANTEAIVYAYNNGIVEGYADGTFKPDATINRAEFVKIAAETFDSDENIDRCTSNPTYTVTDIAKTDWFAKYVCATSTGHGNGDRNPVQGNPDGTFRPGQPVNFVEAAKILSIYTETRMLERREAENNPDTSGIITTTTDSKEWYARYVAYLDKVNAIPLTILKPSQAITRGEMAEMIYRIKTGNQNKPSQRLIDLEKGTIIPASHIQMIYDYYRFLEFDSTLTQAYNLRAEKDMDFDTFKATYGNVAFASVYSVNKTDDNTYTFYVLMAQKDGTRKLFNMTMLVTAENKLDTILSSELAKQTLETYDLSAIADATIQIEYDNGTIALMYYSKGAQTEVDRIDLSKTYIGTTERTYYNGHFIHLELSSDKRFLKYIPTAYEGSATVVYDLVTKREVSAVAGAHPEGFTPDMKYYYACSGYDNGEETNVFINTVPDFTRQILSIEKRGDFDCKDYDRKTNTLTFTSLNPTTSAPTQHIFDFTTGKLR